LLNHLPGLTYDAIKEGVEAAVWIYPDITPIELFHRYGYKTYFTSTRSAGLPEPSAIPESFGNPFRPIESSEQPPIRAYCNDERAEKTRPEVINISEEEGSVGSGNNDIREEESVDSGNNSNRRERENLSQSENTARPPEQQENQQLNQEEQITPKLPVDQLAIPKRVTFTPGPLDSTMEGRGQSSGCDEQQI
jgi:hypothetical protein